ncbi:hypothetical protein TNCV_2584641 [Trichonephila clavipes]|nr:hypothetical protein TNCV_2584641 [Trichonephila clavipes]
MVSSITIGLNRTGHAYYYQMRKFSLSSDCRHQLDLVREWYCLSSRNYPGKGPISDMQYHGCAGQYHDQWPHAPTCGCEWDYDGQRYIDEVLLPHVRLFHSTVGDKFVFMDDNATCHRTLAVQDCQDGRVFNVSYGQRVLQI